MPLYSYQCTKCEKEFELLVASSDVPQCPSCSSKKLERLMSRIAPDGKSRGYAKNMRAAAAREGHLSNYSRSERGRR
ncbi:MAG: zinc ribbon domain-containing protein [Hyphomicrobium sp.]|jgi:putative FmdB family regulatory protein